MCQGNSTDTPFSAEIILTGWTVLHVSCTHMILFTFQFLSTNNIFKEDSFKILDRFPEFTEFPFNSGKTPTLFYIVYKSLCCVYQVEDKSLKKWLRIKTMKGTLSHPGKTFSEQKRMYMTIEFIYQMRFGVSHNVASLHGLNGIRIISCFVSERMPELNHMIQIHGPDAGTSFAEVVRTMDDLVRSGKVRYVGACNLTGWQMQKFVEVTRQLGANPWVTLQVILPSDSESCNLTKLIETSQVLSFVWDSLKLNCQ